MNQNLLNLKSQRVWVQNKIIHIWSNKQHKTYKIKIKLFYHLSETAQINKKIIKFPKNNHIKILITLKMSLIMSKQLNLMKNNFKLWITKYKNSKLQ